MYVVSFNFIYYIKCKVDVLEYLVAKEFHIFMINFNMTNLCLINFWLKINSFKCIICFYLTKIFNLPLKQKRITLLKSPHVNKAAREQFELRSYKSVFLINSNLSYEFTKILFKNKPQIINVSVKTVRGIV